MLGRNHDESTAPPPHFGGLCWGSYWASHDAVAADVTTHAMRTAPAGPSSCAFRMVSRCSTRRRLWACSSPGERYRGALRESAHKAWATSCNAWASHKHNRILSCSVRARSAALTSAASVSVPSPEGSRPSRRMATRALNAKARYEGGKSRSVRMTMSQEQRRRSRGQPSEAKTGAGIKTQTMAMSAASWKLMLWISGPCARAAMQRAVVSSSTKCTSPAVLSS
mmetsp:Transcript_74419/g.206648  ORF Transcript_74419/g.206648 Transcript_74419/m.206648 type:complete len:224 (-) Transcript_74419:1072-1743(-)